MNDIINGIMSGIMNYIINGIMNDIMKDITIMEIMVEFKCITHIIFSYNYIIWIEISFQQLKS